MTDPSDLIINLQREILGELMRGNRVSAFVEGMNPIGDITDLEMVNGLAVIITDDGRFFVDPTRVIGISSFPLGF